MKNKRLLYGITTGFLLLALLTTLVAFACGANLTMLSSILAGDKDVKNARPTPVFIVENFRDSVAVKFLVVGDWGTGAAFQKRVAAAMLIKADTAKPAFIISTGDNIYNSGVTSVNDPQWKTKFEDIYAGKGLELPWYVVLGNHDHRGNVQAEIDYHARNSLWNLPARYYSFVQTIDSATTIEFFALDTDPIHLNAKEFIETQNVWLRTQLNASKARWKVVVGHHPVRSYGGYGDQKELLQHIKPLLDGARVDLYMNGHEHDLQYVKSPEDQFYCLTSGNGGESRHTAYGTNTIFAATNGGFNFIAATRERLYIEFVNTEGKVLFATSIRKGSK